MFLIVNIGLKIKSEKNNLKYETCKKEKMS